MNVGGPWKVDTLVVARNAATGLGGARESAGPRGGTASVSAVDRCANDAL
jgi:hypothetical protein